MILHKYVNFDGDDIIRNLRIKVSKPTEFNDPFEYLPGVVDVSPEQAYNEIFENEEYLKHLHKYGTSVGSINVPYASFADGIKTPAGHAEVLRRMLNIAEALRATCREVRDKPEPIFMTCFCSATTESHNEILMWAHYANGHRGYRIAFDKDLLGIHDKNSIEIKYETDRVQLNPVDYWRRGNVGLTEAFSKCINTKSAVWSYENEYRWLVVSSQCYQEGNTLFIRINPKAITEVICGEKCMPEQVLAIKNLVRSKLGDDVKFRKAKIDDREFKLNYIECP